MFIWTAKLFRSGKFVEFAVVEDLRAESLGQFILVRIGLGMKLCRGQGCDRVANMGGHLPGAHALIRSKYSLAKYVHCIAHPLYLVLTDSSQISDIKHCVNVIPEAISFFHFISK